MYDLLLDEKEKLEQENIKMKKFLKSIADDMFEKAKKDIEIGKKIYEVLEIYRKEAKK